MRTVLFVTIASLALSGLGGANAAAERPSTVIVFGDSYAASKLPDKAGPQCPHPLESWPTQLRQLQGREVADFACTGASIDSGPGHTAAHQLHAAVETEALGPHTRAVVIQLGINDAWGANNTRLWPAIADCVFNLTRSCGVEAASQGRMPDYRGVTGTRFAERLRPTVDYVRYAAPDARIVVVGYPQMFPSHQNIACVGFYGLTYIQPRGRAAVEYLDRIDIAQREAAAILGAEFFDTRAVTAGHDLCSPQPWLNGINDPRGDIGGMTFHPSVRGHAVLAAALARAIE